jgi:hypothetical protein
MDRRVSFGLCAAALIATHLSLLSYFVEISRLFSAEPMGGDDFETHIAQTYRVLEGLEHFGKSWVYDIKLLAGQPEGTIFDADNKGWEVWTFLLYSLGVPKGMGFNLYILGAHVGCPLALFLAARLFGIGWFASLLAAFFGSLLWFFDSFNHWAWWVGMVAYGSAGYFVVVPMACFYRFVQDRKLRHAIASAVLLALAHLNHPYSFFVLLPALAALYLQHRRTFVRREHLLVAGIVLFTLAVNSYWLYAAFSHWHYILDSAYFGQTGPSYLVADFFGVLLSPSDTGVIGTRASMRFMCLALAVVSLALWRRERDGRFAVFTATIGVAFALAYFGPYIPYAGQVQPYRHVVPLGYVSAIAASAAVERVFTSGALATAAASLRWVMVVAVLMVVQLIGRDALYFMPDLVPQVRPAIDGVRSPVTEHGYGWMDEKNGITHVAYRLPRGEYYRLSMHELTRWLEKNTETGDRVLVDAPPVGERLAWRTDLEVLGGFRQMNIEHAYANFFRQFEQPVTHDQVTEYLSAYAVRWVILHARRSDLERSPWLTKVKELSGGLRVYRNRVAVSPITLGQGRLRARTNRIEVWASDPAEDLVLSYHFHEKLRCTPDCRVEREPHRLSRVGFIRVPAPHPRDFVIWNGYQ